MRLLLVFPLWLLFSQVGGQPVARFCFDEPSGEGFTVDSVRGISLPLSNHYGHPERIDGIRGNALRLDGHSTWASEPGIPLDAISGQMTVEVWYATEAFSPQAAAIVSQSGQNTGFELAVSPVGEVLFSFFADHQEVKLSTIKRLAPYEWNHIAAMADLTHLTAKIYVNGALWAEKQLSAPQQLNVSGTSFYIGRSSRQEYFDGYLLNVLNGAVDELLLYSGGWSESEISEHYQKYAEMKPALTIDTEARHGNDNLRPRYHPMPQTGWANENYGLVYHQGKYHMFFQKNPNFPSLYFMHWGHLSSPDLVNWQEEKMALRPSLEFDKFGVWSGAVIPDVINKPLIFYTGVDGARAGIGKAETADPELSFWEKSAVNPVLAGPPGGYNHMDFRDPFIWKEGGYWYMIVGSGLQNQGGGLLFSFRSADLLRWQVIDPVFQRSDVATTGIFWEMPSMTRLNDTDYLLCITPVPLPGKKARAIYWTGTFRNEMFVPYSEAPKSFELMDGNLLSPAIGRDEQGDLVYSAIIPESRSVADQKKAGWRHTFSVVRSLRLLADRQTLGHIPHPNLCRLRGEHTLASGKTLLPETVSPLPEISGNQKELLFMLDIEEASLFEIHLMKNPDETEITRLVFDIDSSRIGFDRRHSTLSEAEKDVKEAVYPFNRTKPLRVHIFLDHSTVEVFIDQLVVFSGRIYPSLPESSQSGLVVKKGRVVLESLDAWDLKRAGEEMGNEVCLPSNLPDALFTTGVAVKTHSGGTRLTVYPLPLGEFLHFDFHLETMGMVTFDLYDIAGRKVAAISPGTFPVGRHHHTVDTSQLNLRPHNLYLARMAVDGRVVESIKIFSSSL
jgi:sucrose-6-phosphate hydrolase SacC (GH32 family)